MWQSGDEDGPQGQRSEVKIQVSAKKKPEVGLGITATNTCNLQKSLGAFSVNEFSQDYYKGNYHCLQTVPF